MLDRRFCIIDIFKVFAWNKSKFNHPVDLLRHFSLYDYYFKLQIAKRNSSS